MLAGATVDRAEAAASTAGRRTFCPDLLRDRALLGLACRVYLLRPVLGRSRAAA